MIVVHEAGNRVEPFVLKTRLGVKVLTYACRGLDETVANNKKSREERRAAAFCSTYLAHCQYSP